MKQGIVRTAGGLLLVTLPIATASSLEVVVGGYDNAKLRSTSSSALPDSSRIADKIAQHNHIWREVFADAGVPYSGADSVIAGPERFLRMAAYNPDLNAMIGFVYDGDTDVLRTDVSGSKFVPENTAVDYTNPEVFNGPVPGVALHSLLVVDGPNPDGIPDSVLVNRLIFFGKEGVDKDGNPIDGWNDSWVHPEYGVVDSVTQAINEEYECALETRVD